MKTLILITLVLFLGQGFAQGSFYVRPKFEARSYMGSSYMANKDKISLFNFDYTTYQLANPFMQVKTSRMSFQNVYNIGLNIGYIFPNENQLEIGWNQDATGSLFSFYGWSDQVNSNNTYYYFGKNSFHSLVLSQRFEFNYYHAFKNSKRTEKLHWSNPKLTVGTGFKFSPAAFTKKESIPLSYPYFVAGGASIGDEDYEWRHVVYAVNRFTPFVTIGLACDLNYNKAYLFSVQFSYTQGLELMEATHHFMDVYKNNILTSVYAYQTYSRGSGFQLQISRRLQFYPWKMGKKQ